MMANHFSDFFGEHSFSRWRERITMDTLRPLPVFLGISSSLCISSEAFSPPSKHLDKDATEKYLQRINANFSYFLTNYVFIAASTTIVVALMHPIMIMYIGIIWLLWSTHYVIIENNIEVIFWINWSVELRSIILKMLTAVVIVYSCLVPVFIMLGVTGVIVTVHAVMRDPKNAQSFSTNRRGSEDSDDSGEIVEKEDLL